MISSEVEHAARVECDEGAGESGELLTSFIHMCVVDECSSARWREPYHKGIAWRDDRRGCLRH